MTRPVPLPVTIDAIPAALRAERRWVLWRYGWDGKRWTKRPYQRHGGLAKSNDPSTWCAFDAAVATYRTGRVAGVGFIIGEGWAGLDFDDCHPPSTDPAATPDTVDAAWPFLHTLDRWATACYRERSPSATGVKVIGRSSRVGGEIDFAETPPAFTTYAAPRFFAVTGWGGGDPLTDLTPLLDAWFPPAPTLPLSSTRADHRDRGGLAPPPALCVSSTRDGYRLAAESSDEDLLCAMIARDRHGEAILRLWRGETGAYGHDQSRADLALCCHLAFWTNYDVARIDRLFQRSGLYRPKWDRDAYRRATLTKALAGGLPPPPTIVTGELSDE